MQTIPKASEAIADLRAQQAQHDAEQDARLRAILTPRLPRQQKRTVPAWPAWLPAQPLKPVERRRLRDEIISRSAFMQTRKQSRLRS